jgi:prevent-host-death family protein
MIKTISVTEAKNKLSTMLQWASEQGGGVVIESRGEPKAVIISYDEYEEFRTLKEEARRRQALRELEELAERMWAANADMTDEEVEQLAEEITQETFERMIKEGKVRYQS